MEPEKQSCAEALRTARENEQRWLAMSTELSSDAEQMEQWRSTARLRRQEVVRLEGLLAESAESLAAISRGGRTEA